MIEGLIASVLLAQSAPPSVTEGVLPRCAPFELYRKVLAERYGEAETWWGAGGDDALVLFARPDGTSWTLVRLEADKRACLMAVGKAHGPYRGECT